VVLDAGTSALTEPPQFLHRDSTAAGATP